MILIAHRGNISGPTEYENQPEYIAEASASFDVEVDVWYQDGWFLGHDGPQYPVDIEFLRNPGLWLHCKNIEALQRAVDQGLHCFYHTNEHHVLTSRGYIWTYPGLEGGDICVLPELNNQSIAGFAGVCSDWIGSYKSS